MNNDSGIILQMQEDGVWGIKKEPYCTIEVVTKEDYEELQKALEKQMLKPVKITKPSSSMTYVTCSICGKFLDDGAKDNYCYGCGQKLDWSMEDE